MLTTERLILATFDLKNVKHSNETLTIPNVTTAAILKCLLQVTKPIITASKIKKINQDYELTALNIKNRRMN